MKNIGLLLNLAESLGVNWVKETSQIPEHERMETSKITHTFLCIIF